MSGLPALWLPMIFEASCAPVAVVTHSLRRPDLRVRRTQYRGIVVDEQVLTRGFPPIGDGPERTEIFVLESGRATFRLEDGPVELAVGEPWFASRRIPFAARFEDACFFEADWPVERTTAPRRVAPHQPELLELARSLPSIGNEVEAQRAFLERLFRVLDALGIPFPAELRALPGPGPTERDLRLGQAITDQLANLRREATVPHLGDDAELSPRQLQRVVEAFNVRYGINSRNWRDTRTRWRVQIALSMLSVPGLPIADIAREVGFASATVLARAFAQRGFPPPSEVRNALLDD